LSLICDYTTSVSTNYGSNDYWNKPNNFTRRVGIDEWIIQAIRIPVKALRKIRSLNEVIGREEAADKRVVKTVIWLRRSLRICSGSGRRQWATLCLAIRFQRTIKVRGNIVNFGKIFGVSVDGILNPGKELPNEVTAEEKTTMEQMRLLQQLDEEDRQTIFRLLEKMLTNKKFKDFFQKNLAAL